MLVEGLGPDIWNSCDFSRDMVIFPSCKFLMCFLVNVMLCDGQNSKFTVTGFNEALNSNESFSVYYYGKEIPKKGILDQVLDSIDMSTSVLTKNSLKMMAANCDLNTNLEECKDRSKLHSAVLYKAGEISSVIPGDNLLSAAELAINMLHHNELPSSQSPELASVEELEQFKQQHKERSNVFVFYIPYMGSSEHLEILRLVKMIPETVSIAYTLNKDILDDGNIMHFFNYISPREGPYETFSSRSSINAQFLKSIAEVTSVDTPLPDDDFISFVEDRVASGKDILILLAGKGVRQSAFKIARNVVSSRPGLTVSVIDRTITMHTYIQPRVRDGKIFALLAKKGKESAEVVDIGYLQNDDENLLLSLFDEARMKQDEIWERLEEDPEFDDDGIYPYPENILDDPISYSLHHSEKVKKLYYFDHKTLPRLTDKTYAKLINSKKYSVILFTLEFNPRAVAALVTFAEIHKAYKESGQSSPLYRVECYNWPDVCEEAEVYTSPRLFFYPKGSSERIEYSGLWDKVSMKDDILRYSNPEVIVLKKKEDILPYNPMTIRSLIGFFENDEGTNEFRKAAKIMRKDYQFIEVHGAVGDLISESYEIDFSHKTVVGFEHGFPKEKIRTFSTADDIIDYLKVAFQPEQVQELSIYSFVEVMKDPKPFLIYFWDQTNGNKKEEYTQLKDTIQDISTHDNLANKMLFTWMDSSSNSVGEFVLKQYNRKAQVYEPTVAFFDKKGSVILKSCDTCDNQTLIAWLQDCLDGKVETTYGLNTEEWKPRLEGFDYIEFMKQEGTYPRSQYIMKKLVEDGKITMPEHSKGNPRRVTKVKSEESDETVVDENPQYKGSPVRTSTHEEL